MSICVFVHLYIYAYVYLCIYGCSLRFCLLFGCALCFCALYIYHSLPGFRTRHTSCELCGWLVLDAAKCHTQIILINAINRSTARIHATLRPKVLPSCFLPDLLRVHFLAIIQNSFSTSFWFYHAQSCRLSYLIYCQALATKLLPGSVHKKRKARQISVGSSFSLLVVFIC